MEWQNVPPHCNQIMFNLIEQHHKWLKYLHGHTSHMNMDGCILFFHIFTIHTAEVLLSMNIEVVSF